MQRRVECLFSIHPLPPMVAVRSTGRIKCSTPLPLLPPLLPPPPPPPALDMLFLNALGPSPPPPPGPPARAREILLATSQDAIYHKKRGQNELDDVVADIARHDIGSY